jgi:predicted MPP superfamily phosphohydrolase
MKRRTFLKGIMAAAAVTLSGVSAYAYRSRDLEVSHERLVIPKINRNLRIVSVSDVHAPCFYSSYLELYRILNELQADIFILAGDTIDKQGNEGLVGIFREVNTRLIKLATLGNWEYLGKLDLIKLKTEYKNAGISLLVNAVYEVQGLTIVGLDDFALGTPDYKIISDVSTDGPPVLIISHCPESFDFLTSFSKSPVIVLSGHTHGGQIVPFGIVLSTPPGSGSYVKGWYHKGEHSMYVMRGIGTTPGLPIRIGARPEVLVLDIVPA